ncbi:RagB/SusD family nutrient uptake outer membrane protein [Pedobacter sp. ASV1-7]|uniref:RagB/SusD family nutrient uptake outer membrane protein n=1 Tax=Pedobacter sp. ASV1-7 TaxID=3145237 RepID=UPI0032E86885
MKRNLLFAFVLLFIITSCKKEKAPEPQNEDRKPEVIIKEITSKLAGADSISTFTAALKNIVLTAEETAQGITVFAPLNQNSSPQARINKMASLGGGSGKLSDTNPADTAKTVLTDVELRDHIVKGVFNFSDLTNGKILTGLNGNQLKVTRSADTVWINGIRIGGHQIVSSGNEAVYAVKSILTGTNVNDEPESTSLEVTVWDATMWSAAKSKGEAASDALVTLYNSQKDYADSIPAQEGRTDVNGKVIFKTVSPGIYYIKVTQGTKSNIFNRSAKQGGLYTGYVNAGIFQNQTEINAAPIQVLAVPGDFKWVDVNGDGVINNNDRITLPNEKATVVAGALRKVEVMIGKLKNTQAEPYTEVAFNANLSVVESNLAAWHKKLVLIDGLLGPNVTIDSIPQIYNTVNYQMINNFAMTPTNPVLEEIWRKGYESIASLSVLQDRIPNVMTDRNTKLAQVRGMKAYIYLQLLTYYGNISLLQTTGNLNNQNRAAVYSYITTELQEAAAALSATGSPTSLNSLTVLALSAKAALLDKKYTEAAAHAEAVINAGKYTLATMGGEFSTNSPEIIWNNSSGMDANIKNYFYQRTSLPYLRLTEVYLTAIEANIALNNITKAQGYFDALHNRSRYNLLLVSMSNLRALWVNQCLREGGMFANFLRWGTVSQFAFRGFVEGKNNRLPIPQNVIDTNPQMRQNPGY